MALRRFTYHNATKGYLEEQAADDELSLGKVTAIGVGGVALDASGQQILDPVVVEEFTASGAISKGTGVRISANDTVSAGDASQSFSYSPIYGVALTDAAAGATVLVVKSGRVPGVLSGAVAGTPYFLAPSTGLPVTIDQVPAGDQIVLLGFAANATDLVVMVRDYKAATSGGGGGSSTPNPVAGIQPIDASILLEWKLNEASGSSFANTGSAGSGAALSTTGSPILGRLTPIGNGVQFVGVAADKLLGASMVEPNPSLFAAEYFFFPKRTQGSTYGQTFGKAYRNDGTWNAPYSGFNIAVNSSNDGRIYYSATVAGAARFTTTPLDNPLLYGKLNHVVFTFDGSQVQLILNGDLVSTMALSGSIDWGLHGPWFVGGDPANGNEALMGIVNHIRVHDGTIRSLSYWQSQWRSVMGWSA